jgi:hypothetical protein
MIFDEILDFFFRNIWTLWMLSMVILNIFAIKCNFSHENFYLSSISMNSFSLFYTCTIEYKNITQSEDFDIDTSLNEDPNSEVTAFKMDFCKTSFIPKEIYKTFKNLVYLTMLWTSLEKLEPNFFDGAKKLKYFWLRRSEVTELDAGTFIKAGNLKYINLKYNLIRFIHKNSFDGLSELIEINLKFNHVQMIHYKTFSALTSLDKLFLNNNNGYVCISKDFDLTATIDKKLYYQAIENCLKTCHDNYIDEMMDRGLTAYEKTVENQNVIGRFENETYENIMELQRKIDNSENQTYEEIKVIRDKVVFQNEDQQVSISTILISMGCCFVISVMFIVGAVFYLRYVLKNNMIHLANRILTQSELHYNHYDNLWNAKFPDANSSKLENAVSKNSVVRYNKPISTVSELISKDKDEITEMKRIMNIL